MFYATATRPPASSGWLKLTRTLIRVNLRMILRRYFVSRQSLPWASVVSV